MYFISGVSGVKNFCYEGIEKGLCVIKYFYEREILKGEGESGDLMRQSSAF